MEKDNKIIWVVSEGLQHDGSEAIAAFYHKNEALDYAKSLKKKTPYFAEVTPVPILTNPITKQG